MSADPCDRSVGGDERSNPRDVQQQVEAHVPASRLRLFPALAMHARMLTGGFDQIGDLHRERSRELVDWIVDNFRPGRPLEIIFICTGNSRRSVLGAVMGNVAASYYGLPEVRCYSGGTEPGAVNERTIATLKEIGIEFTPLGEEAPRGPEGIPNPVFNVRWGRPEEDPSLETTEFSKRFDDQHNPRQGFAALLVCSEAEASCPAVSGAAVRIAIPYLDPKLYDDTESERRRYAERRDDIARLLLAVMLQARLRLTSAGKL